ncbi:MAG: DUF4402 domain-containing protein [Bacillota bacterium]
MSANRRLLAASAAAALLLPAASRVLAAPVPARTNAAGKAAILKSLSILKRADLDFGELVVASAGTAVIDPVTGAVTTTGTITKIGTTAHPATFTATGSRNAVVNIRLPTAPITLTRVGGGGTMTVSNWTLDGKPNRKIPLNSAFDFNVGATLNVGANQADGTYAGTFTVTVQYP